MTTTSATPLQDFSNARVGGLSSSNPEALAFTTQYLGTALGALYQDGQSLPLPRGKRGAITHE